MNRWLPWICMGILAVGLVFVTLAWRTEKRAVEREREARAKACEQGKFVALFHVERSARSGRPGSAPGDPIAVLLWSCAYDVAADGAAKRLSDHLNLTYLRGDLEEIKRVAGELDDLPIEQWGTLQLPSLTSEQ